MAEQTFTRRPAVAVRPPAAHAATASVPPAPASSQESMRRAKSCLDASNRRLKRGEAGKTDEVLNLLRAAAAHLQQACSIQGQDLTGAE